MRIRIILLRLLAALLILSASSYAQSPAPVVGWYNGDRASPPIPGMSNWYLSDTAFARVYDNFAVPSGGWTVAGVFSNNTFYGAPEVTRASWEIRSGISTGNGGTVVASGVNSATQTYDSGTNSYRIQVDGLQVQLAPGTYWLSVTPAGLSQDQAYVCATLGAKATGTPPGNDGSAFYDSPPANRSFVPAQSTGPNGTSSDFSQGVLVAGLPLPAISRVEQWRADLAYLAQQMLLLHSVPFPGISVADFRAKANDLSNRVPAISDAEVRTGIEALVAAIEDPHTDVSWPSPSPFRFLPLSLYWFDDGIYLTRAPEQYQDLLGARLVSIGQTSIEEATARLTALVPHENDSWLKYLLPLNRLTNTDFLFGTGITPNTAGAQLVTQTASGDMVSAEVQALYQQQFSRTIPVFQGDLPLYRQHPERNYWATAIDGGATVYFQYNSCNEDPRQASADFLAELDGLLAQDGVQRLIVDLRNNTGGFVTILNPWIDRIKSGPFNRPGRLFVIVGRATFSAAMDASNRFREETAATFVGEPTGAKPRFLNRKGAFALPYSGIRVSYSNGVINAKDDGPTLVPDIQTGLTFQDYMNGVDPALDAIEAIPLPEGN